MDLRSFVRDVPDFPIPGIVFRDISNLLSSPEAFKYAVSEMVKSVDLKEIDFVVGIESRGFILGAAMAAQFQKGFVPMRKAGKLPPPVQTLSYSLEYGEATLEVAHGKGRVLIVDDILATGGTLDAAVKLCVRAGYSVESLAVLINLKVLNQFRFQGREVPSVLIYE
jgi:adenine phosphoribosyltransferase